MKDVSVEVLGLNFTIFGTPETVSEFDANAKKEGACLAEAINNIKYRSTFPDIRSAFLELLERTTNIKRKTKPGPAKKDGSAGAEVYDESESKYFARVCAEFTPEGAAEPGVDAKHFQYLADQINNGEAPVLNDKGEPVIEEATGKPQFVKIVFDASAAERTGEKKIAKVYLDGADQFLKRDADWQARAAANLEKLNEGVSIAKNEDGTYNRESVAVAIKANEDRKRKESIDSLA